MSWPGRPTLGATYLGEHRTRFRVWAPFAETVDVQLQDPIGRRVRLTASSTGYHTGIINGVSPGARYTYVLDDEREYPDPASRSQPDGVHGPSAVVDPTAFTWKDAGWTGLPLRNYVIYELHVGTFSDDGTFDGVIPYLDGLADLGVTAIELMPVAQFPGDRNWGYDGVYPFAVQSNYGGLPGLQRLVDACHQRGLAVILDVVYNHLGPEGNYLGYFGPYISERYDTPWGPALNFDGPGSDDVRRYFIENALYLLDTLHIDALRLDAIHAIVDTSAQPFLQQLATTVHERAEQLGRRITLFAESDLNAPRVVLPPIVHGLGLDAVWNDDFHHAIDSLIDGSPSPYHADYGRLADLVRAYRDGFVYSGQYSRLRQRRFGAPATQVRGEQLVVYIQNHDQVGNRVEGERLTSLASFADLKLAAAALLLSPFVPLIFMGEEYGERAPFQYFTSHSDPDVIDAVRRGRQTQFPHLGQGAPDPQDPASFQRSRLRRADAQAPWQRQLAELYRTLLRLRRTIPALAELNRQTTEVLELVDQQTLVLRRWTEQSEIVLALVFAEHPVPLLVPHSEATWQKRLDTAEVRWGGPGSAAPEEIGPTEGRYITVASRSAVLYERAATHDTFVP